MSPVVHKHSRNRDRVRLVASSSNANRIDALCSCRTSTRCRVRMHCHHHDVLSWSSLTSSNNNNSYYTHLHAMLRVEHVSFQAQLVQHQSREMQHVHQCQDAVQIDHVNDVKQSNTCWIAASCACANAMCCASIAATAADDTITPPTRHGLTQCTHT